VNAPPLLSDTDREQLAELGDEPGNRLVEPARNESDVLRHVRHLALLVEMTLRVLPARPVFLQPDERVEADEGLLRTAAREERQRRALEDAELAPVLLYWRRVEAMDPPRLIAMRGGAHGLARPRALADMVERVLLRRIGVRDVPVESHVPTAGSR